MANEQPVRPHLQFKVNKLRTIKVKMKDGGNECIINESDFDPEKHVVPRVAPNKPSAPAKKAVPQRKEKEEEEK